MKNLWSSRRAVICKMFLIKQKGDIISDYLVVTGGPGDNTLISIKG